MSHVTNIVILMPLYEEGSGDRIPPLEKLNGWLAENGRGKLHRVDQHGGNTKVMECAVAIGAFNDLDIDEFTAAFGAAGWREIENVKLMVMDQEDEVFSDRSADLLR